MQTNDKPQDPSVTRVTNTGMEETDDFNPFSARALNNLNETTIPAPNASQPAVLQPTVEPSLRATAAAAQAELHKQQAELEKRAAELQRKEEELQNRDTAMDHCVTLFLNLLACLAFFTVDTQNGVDFGLSILWFVLFSPGAFVCWSDSSFSFFFFFFIFSFQVVVYIIQSVGIPKWGNSVRLQILVNCTVVVCVFSLSGWITSISVIRSNLAVAVFMMVVAGFFTVNAVLATILLKTVHGKYRRTGASFQKAQQEFSQGVVTSNTFQTAASSAVRGAFQ
ncbi:hypothetical protein P4O66_006741 [Electrophorus voltai]|uniref:Secretory carrier-associated membrane protein n=1 Tax=Electrophorus voltai TaxID=2609070 RepID=A0AAD9E0Z9_9TELE|nr:hypothetical protein P4O66_006741 [Electrophorus voltai]